jgi:hypothetical protein
MDFCGGADNINHAPATANIFSIVKASKAQIFLHLFHEKNFFNFRDLPN